MIKKTLQAMACNQVKHSICFFVRFCSMAEDILIVFINFMKAIFGNLSWLLV